VPECYKQTPPRLKPGYFSKFGQDTLFYIFYSMPADEAQIFAADELSSRGWGFNKELKVHFRHSAILSLFLSYNSSHIVGRGFLNTVYSP
jgi:CCR4-NOT transcription complex subunit 2